MSILTRKRGEEASDSRIDGEVGEEDRLRLAPPGPGPLVPADANHLTAERA